MKKLILMLIIGYNLVALNQGAPVTNVIEWFDKMDHVNGLVEAHESSNGTKNFNFDDINGTLIQTGEDIIDSKASNYQVNDTIIFKESEFKNSETKETNSNENDAKNSDSKETVSNEETEFKEIDAKNSEFNKIEGKKSNEIDAKNSGTKEIDSNKETGLQNSQIKSQLPKSESVQEIPIKSEEVLGKNCGPGLDEALAPRITVPTIGILSVMSILVVGLVGYKGFNYGFKKLNKRNAQLPRQRRPSTTRIIKDENKKLSF